MECSPNQAFSDFYGFQFFADHQTSDMRLYQPAAMEPMLPETSTQEAFSWERSFRSLPYPQVNLEPSRSDAPLRKRPSAAPRRINVNQKERRRNLAINDAFFDLQRLIPHVPREHSLPKIKTLRLAVNYISSLTALLNHDQPSLPEMKTEFARVVASEIQARNSYKDRADQLLREGRSSSMPHEEVRSGEERRVRRESSGCSQASRQQAA